MSDWKYHIGNKFSSCRLVAKARDVHRAREVKIYHIPGEFEYVGVNDSIDCWICPVSADPFSAGVKRQLDRIVEGKDIVPVVEVGEVRKRSVVGHSGVQPLQVSAQAPKERRRARVEPSDPISVPPRIRRHAVHR